MSRLVQNSREKVLCPVFTCKGSGKSKCIYSFLLIVSSKCSNGAVIEGWRIKATKYTSTNTMSFASSAAPGTPQAGLSSLGHLICIQSITKDSCVTAQEPGSGAGLHKSIVIPDDLPALCKHAPRSIWRCTGAGGKWHCDGKFPFLCLHSWMQVPAWPPSAARRQENEKFFSVRQDWQGRQEGHDCSHMEEKSRGVKVGNPKDSRGKVNSWRISTKPTVFKSLGEFA